MCSGFRISVGYEFAQQRKGLFPEIQLENLPTANAVVAANCFVGTQSIPSVGTMSLRQGTSNDPLVTMISASTEV